MFGELAEPYLDIANFLVWLDMDRTVCRRRLEERGSESKRHLGREQSEEGLRKLVEWASRYYDRQDLRSHVGHKGLFENFSGKKIRIRSEIAVNQFAIKVQQNASLEFHSAAFPENQ